MTDPTASGPNPSGCARCDLDAIERRADAAQRHNEREYFDRESGALIYDDVPDLIYRCRAADKMLAASLDQHERDREQFAARLSASESECARLTAQLAAATARAGEAERDRDVACSNVDALMEKYQAARAALDSPRAAMEQCDAVISIGKERDDAMTALRELWLVCENGDLINENHPVRDVVVAALRAGGGR